MSIRVNDYISEMFKAVQRGEEWQVNELYQGWLSDGWEEERFSERYGFAASDDFGVQI